MTHRFVIRTAWDGAPLPAADHVKIDARLGQDALHLSISAPYFGDPPPDGAPGMTWGLWEHEVVELFLVGADARYTEIEIGPHGHFLVLRLEGRRNVTQRVSDLNVTTRIEGGRWSATATLPRRHLPMAIQTGNAFSISGVGDARRYCAATAVPGPSPDFHRLECFPTLAL